MPKFVIERHIPGAAQKSESEWQEIVERSCAILREMGPEVEWVQSYVASDKLYCVFNAPDRESVLRHSLEGRLPVERVERVWRVIEPPKLRPGVEGPPSMLTPKVV